MTFATQHCNGRGRCDRLLRATGVVLLTTALVTLSIDPAAAQSGPRLPNIPGPPDLPSRVSDDDGPVLIDPANPPRPLTPGAPRPGGNAPRPSAPTFSGPRLPPPPGDDDADPNRRIPDASPFPREPFAPDVVRPAEPPHEDRRDRGWRPPHAPPPGDFSAESLRRSSDALRRRYGPSDREIPPAVKAEFLQWVLTRYHLAPYKQVHHTVALPEEPGPPPEYTFGDDVSTWNGALLAAMSYKYAVTGDPETLDLICVLIDGLHFFQQVTGKRGLFARCVVQSPQPVLRANKPYAAPDGTMFHFRSDAAKGTYNQIAIGYATALLLVGDQLPAETQQRARHDLSEMVTHLLDHDYRITEADGKKSKYGDLRPLIGPFSVPFNAQVAYTMVAASAHLPGPDLIAQKMIRKEFERLRYRHHVYFENPLQHALAPQMVSTSPFVKGMNDHNHLVNAAYLGIMLELVTARKQSRQPDTRYLFEQGQTLAWTMQEIQTERNALCGFMYAGLFRDPVVFQSVVPRHSQDSALRQLDYIVATSAEQLRRAPLDRFYVPGRKVEAREPQWVDAQRPDEVYFWKAGAMSRWEPTGPPSNILTCGTDYLYAYWLARYFQVANF